MKKTTISIILGIVCLMLTVSIVVQVNTIKGTNSTVTKKLAEDELRDEVLKWKEKYDNATLELENAEKELSRVREDSTQNNDDDKNKQEEITLNNNLLGLTNLEGKGIELTVADNPDATSENIGVLDDISKYIVHYNDIIALTNELKNAGAEAISVNGQRIVSSTAITCIGNVIKINDEKVSSPFVIKAIGFPESLKGALTRGGGYLSCAILMTVMFAQFKTIEETDITGIETAREEELRTMISSWKSKYEETSEKLEETNQKINEYQEKVSSNQESSELLEQELLQTNKLVGKTEVTGEGIIITLSDNNETTILDTDLLKLINELRLAGAEAISINDVRVVGMTDIVEVNDTILVNEERVVSPYVVKAIGNQTYLSSALSLKNSGFIDMYTSSGKTVKMTIEKNIKIPAYRSQNNLMQFRYAKEAE